MANNNFFEVIIAVVIVVDIEGHHWTRCSRVNAAAGAAHNNDEQQ